MIEPVLQAPITVGESASQSWRSVTRHLGPMVGFTVVYYIASYIIGLIPIVGSFTGVFSFIYTVGLYSAFQSIDRHGTLSFSDFFIWSPKFVKLLAAQVAMFIFAIVVFLPLIIALLGILGTSWLSGGKHGFEYFAGMSAGLLVGVGIFTFIGILILGICTFALYFIVAFTDTPLWEAFKLSWKVGRNNIGQLILIGLLSMAIVILGALALLIGLLVAVPVIVGIQYYFLRSIFPEETDGKWDFMNADNAADAGGSAYPNTGSY